MHALIELINTKKHLTRLNNKKPPVLRMVSGNGFFRLESDTSRTAAGATLYQWQNNEWVLVGYHSKRLPDAV